ncbi:MAG: SMI1/KNR4 family protein [Planctomycetota bacterium]
MTVKLRNLRELRWRRKGPPLPPSVLDAAKLKIDPESTGRWVLPAAYRAFLSHMDGGRPGVQKFTENGREWTIEAFYTFADAANMAEKLRKAGKLPEGYLPVAMTEAKQPLVFVELNEEGQVWIRTSPRARFDDRRAVYLLVDDFAEFLDLLGDDEDTSMHSSAAASPWGVVTEEDKPRPRAKAKPAPIVDDEPVTEGKGSKKKEPKEPKPATGKPATKKKATTKPVTKKKPATKKKATKAAAKPATKKKSATKKSATKKAPAKKAPAKKAPAKAAKKAPAKKAAKKAPAKKAAKKAPAKKAAKKKR